MKTSQEIRSAFLSYFEGKGHRVVPSAPLVPHNDPTLMFTNAGMVPFKNVFTGQEKRPYNRATSSQKCVRAGGKHNDLDNVGYTARHHTFFEMLGNFSFGDYFKEDAIAFAWELINKEFGIDRNRLLVTVYHEDDEAFSHWRRIGLPEDRIIRIATSDNFWSMGDTGPCGPCSEIFYDHGEHIAGGPPGSADADGDRFVEIWNLVFMQFDQKANGERVPLARTGIDTGMGLERVAAVLQGVHDNYDTDILRGLVEASAHFSNIDPDGPQKVSHRVIADHIRAVSFLIADGVLPSNEGRGYVLRRIMRRGMRHAHMLGVKEPLLWKLVPTLVGSMGQAYPELVRAEALISETLKLEEDRFRQMLDRGLKLLSDEVGKLGSGTPLPGEVAFRLYDTYGFPLDLTQDVLRAEGRVVDTSGFDRAMAHQRAEARKAWAGSGEAATDDVWFRIRDEKGATEFLGYNAIEAEGRLDAIVRDGAPQSSAEKGDTVLMVVNQTPFYGESGGQMGDTGTIAGPRGKAVIKDAQKVLGDLVLHIGEVVEGRFTVGEDVHLTVDNERRLKLRANHSATHLLHAALRRTLGAHVTQKGSLVAPDRLRFDFSQPRAITHAEINEIESEVNAFIRQNEGVSTRLMTPTEAQAAGAMALFGEKYGEEVRVVSMGLGGEPEAELPYSMELCGGTHVRRTGDIGFFKIVSQSAVSAGVRRIEALTGEAARRFVTEEEERLLAAADVLKASPAELADRVVALVEERKRMERELTDARRKLALSGGGGAAQSGNEVREVAGVRFLGQVLEGVSPKDLRSLVDEAKKSVGSGIVAFLAVSDGKAAIAVGVTDDLTSRFNAVDLVRAGAEALGGKGGGGRPDMAQAGGPDAQKAHSALKSVEQSLLATANAA